jgi:hypothetical protein
LSEELRRCQTELSKLAELKSDLSIGQQLNIEKNRKLEHVISRLESELKNMTKLLMQKDTEIANLTATQSDKPVDEQVKAMAAEMEALKELRIAQSQKYRDEIEVLASTLREQQAKTKELKSALSETKIK